MLEPLVVVVLLFGGAWINRATSVPLRRKSYLRTDYFPHRRSADAPRRSTDSALHSPTSKTGLLDDEDDDIERRPMSPSLLAQEQERWHTRTIYLFGVKKEVVSPNTARFRNRFLSRVLRKFPFLAECWYWALVYWVCKQMQLKGTDLDVIISLTLSSLADIPAWSRFHSVDAFRRYRRCRPSSRSAAHRNRTGVGHILGTKYPGVLHELP